MADSETFHKTVSLEWLLTLLGDLGILLAQVIHRIFTGVPEVRETAYQIRLLGIKSLGIAVLTAVFAGMVLTLQFGTSMARFGAQEMVGQVVAIAILRELGPVLTALMVGGRIGAGMTAELGSMKVTEQIDALRVLGADPIAKLIVPRVLASTLIMPILTAIADIVGVLGGLIISSLEFGISSNYYYSSIIEITEINDFMSGIGKAAVFGFCIGLIACRQGFQTSGGTEGVGQSTTSTVVIASVTVLVADLLLTKLFMVL